MDDDIFRPLAGRSNGKARIAAGMEARIGAHGALIALLVGVADTLRVAEGARLARIALGRELVDVAGKAGAVEVGLRLHQALDAEQHELVALHARLERVA